MARAQEQTERRPVGIWIRVSTAEQARGDSPEHHERRARLYAESRNWTVAAVYRLEAVSGKAVLDHAEAQRMLADLRAGRIKALVFSKLERLARNTKELLEFAETFQEHGADLVSLQESIDTSTPAGRLFYTVIAAMAQWERENIAERVNASIAIRARLGKPLNGRCPFGYRWHEKRIEPHPAEAPVRRLIHELYAEHRRRKTVARLLNEAGHRTRGGHLFTDTTVERLLRDPTAKGLHRANYTKRIGDRQPWQLKPKEEWVYHSVPAIVDAALWDECVAMLDARRQPQRRPGKRPTYLFAGVTYCGCGTKMYVPSNTPKYVCQSCRNKIPTMDLEGVFVEQLRGLFASPVRVRELFRSADEGARRGEELLKAQRGELGKVEAEMQRLERAFYDGTVPAESFGTMHAKLLARKGQLDADIPRLEAELDVARIDHLSADAVLQEATDLYGTWGELTGEEKRGIVETLVERIVVGKGEIDITLCGLPSSENVVKGQRELPPAFTSTTTNGG